MNEESRHLPSNIRNYIVAKAEASEPYQNIVESVEEKYGRIISKGTITKLKEKFEETKSTDDLPRSSRPRIFTESQERALIEAFFKRPKTYCC